MGNFAFQQHKLPEADRLWLVEASKPAFNARTCRVLLRDRLPKDFDASRIDRRLYAEGKLTLLGRWFVDSGDPVFGELDRVIRCIYDLIVTEPELTQVNSTRISERAALDPQRVAALMSMLAPLGRFFSSANGPGQDQGLTSFNFSDDNAYNEYIQYNGLEALLDQQYTRMAGSFPAPMPVASPVDDIQVQLNTAFVLMPIDPEIPELEDVYRAIVETCAEFGIRAYRADVIEHQDRITDRVLHEIRTCEYLVADLSLERPNVYYEVGFAHALHKKPILYRRKGTRLHFDLSVHNVPEFKNATELRQLMRRRLTEILGHGPKTTASS